jgi:FHA domain
MKYNFICEGGKHHNYFSDRNNPPEECKDCYEKFDFGKVVEVVNHQEEEVAGLTIIYQINQQRIEVPASNKTILGRENFGAGIFSNIFFNGKQVVSRKHCSIEYTDGYFYLLDEGSTNGTFYGVNKLSCKNSPQIIEDKSIFYIGEEPFLAQINYKEAGQSKLETFQIPVQQTKAIKAYRCSVCGNEFKEKTADCPGCDRYNTLIDIYE